MDTAVVTLPVGFARDGVWRRDALLRGVCGRDEAYLAANANGVMTPAARMTGLLARCLASLGGIAPVTEADTRALTLGDREALLLHLRRLTCGERIASTLRCPAEGCGALMDLDLRVSELLVPAGEYEDAGQELTVATAKGEWRIRFRLLTGADQEAVALLARDDPDGAAEAALRRCVESVTSPDGKERPDIGNAAAIPPEVQRELAAQLSALDPQAEIRLDACCPECGTTFPVLFDTATYFERELLGRQGSLLREVHTLAWHYHWSEADILALPRRRRRDYLTLIAEALEGTGAR